MKKEDLFDILGDINNQYIKEAHIKNKRKNNYTWAKWATIAACIALLVLRIPMVKHILPLLDERIPTGQSSSVESGNIVGDLQNDKEESVNMQENQMMSEEVQARIDELKHNDIIGWIVYHGRIYIQNFYDEQINIELGNCVGRASDYIGAYNNYSDICDGDVYVVIGNPDMLCIKLNNGATIWLKVDNLGIEVTE